MTKNQIEFWKLVWSNQYKQVELSLDAYKLALQAEEQRLQWAKLTEQVRATLVAEALHERQQVLEEYKAQTEIAYKAAQVQKMVAETDTIRQQMLISVVNNKSTAYVSATAKILDAYSKISGINFGTGGKASAGGLAGIGAGVNINPLFVQIIQEAEKLQYSRDEIDRIYNQMISVVKDEYGITPMPEKSTFINAKQMNEDLESELSKHKSIGQKQHDKTNNNQTYGPGVSKSSEFNKPDYSNANSESSSAPVARQQSGPSATTNGNPSGVKVVASGNNGPGVGRQSTSNTGKSSNVVIAPGVKIFSGPGIK